MRRLLVCIIALVSFAFAPNTRPAARPVVRAFREPGDSVVEAMFNRWNGHVYRTATFIQETRFPTGRRQTWYESFRAPGWLRIDIAPLDSGGTILFREDSVYTGRAGRWSDARPYVRALQMLFTDVFWVPSNATTSRLRALGFDLSLVHRESWRGRPAIVVGALEGDTLSAQFWVDAERLIVERLIEREAQPGDGPLETRVLAHEKAGAGWIESDVVFFQGGREIRHDTYHDIRVDVPLDNAIFIPAGRVQPEWQRKKE